MHTRLTTFGCLSLSLFVAADRAAVAQHVHGNVDLGIVLEDSTLAISVRAPLSDIVGFEHAPENDAQTARLREAGALLSDADAMFGTPEAAGCVADPVTIDAPEYLHAFLDLPEDDGHADDGDHDHEDDHGSGAHADHDHDDHDDHASEAHAEEMHDHDDHDDHASEAHAGETHDHDHDHDDGDHASGSHADIDARYVWQCKEPANLGSVTASFVDGFDNLEKISIEMLTPTGTRVVEADSELDTIQLLAP